MTTFATTARRPSARNRQLRRERASRSAQNRFTNTVSVPYPVLMIGVVLAVASLLNILLILTVLA
jgi:hypothetical protein